MTNQYNIYCPEGKLLGGHCDVAAALKGARSLGDGYIVRTSYGRTVSFAEMDFLEGARGGFRGMDNEGLAESL